MSLTTSATRSRKGLPLIRTALACAGVLALTACAPTVGRHGFQPVDVKPADIKVGEDTKETVMTQLGSPSAVSTFEPNIWFYVAQTTSRYTYHNAQVNSRDVTVIRFDDAEKVAEVRTLDMQDGRQIAYSDRETPTRGRELTVLEQLLGNVGRQVLPETDEDRLPGNRRRD